MDVLFADAFYETDWTPEQPTKETEVNIQPEDVTTLSLVAVDRRGGCAFGINKKATRAADDRHRPMIASRTPSLLVTATDATRHTRILADMRAYATLRIYRSNKTLPECCFIANPRVV